MRDVEHIYMNIPRWTGRNIEEGTPWMEAAAEAESALSQLDSLLGEFGGIGFSSQMGTLSSVTDGINAMRNARKYLHEEIVRLVDKPLEECFARAVEALAAIDFDKIRVENKAGLVVNNVEVGGKRIASQEVNDYSLSDVLKGNVPQLNGCTGYNQKIEGVRELLEEMGGITLAKLENSKADNEKKKEKKEGFLERINQSILNFMAYPNLGRCNDPTGNPPPKSIRERIEEIMIDIQDKVGTDEFIREWKTIIDDKIAEAKQKEAEMTYINKYVNEETLLSINADWNIDKLKELCGENCMEELRELMYDYGVTDETSILMFLCTCGVESSYGNDIKERYDAGYFDDKSYTLDTRGAGLLQVTGETQRLFLEYIYEENKANDESLNEKIKFFMDGYNTYLRGDEVVSFNEAKFEENVREINATDFIAENFALESAVWFWAENNENAVICQEKSKNHVTINTYICDIGADNKNNLFLVTQLMVNGRQDWGFPSLQEMATQEKIVETDSEKIYFKDESGVPNDWLKRRGDWENAVKLIGDD